MLPRLWSGPKRLGTRRSGSFALLKSSCGRPCGPSICRSPPAWCSRSCEPLGHPLWDAPSPQGFSDVTSAWLARDALTNRLDVAERLAMTASVDDLMALVDGVLGPGVSAETRDALRHAETRQQ